MLIDDSVATCYNPPQRKGADMTRTIGNLEAAASPEEQRDFALGALAAAGHSIEDDRALDLLDQLARGDIDFDTFRQLTFELQRAK